MTTHFKKEVPSTPVRLSNGSSVKFEDVDGRVGIFKSSVTGVVDGLREAARAGRGGVSEITEAEFLELIKKKQPSQLRWREEMRAGYARDSLTPPAAAGPVVSLATGDKVQLVPAKPLAQPLTVAEAPKQKLAKFKPKSIK